MDVCQYVLDHEEEPKELLAEGPEPQNEIFPITEEKLEWVKRFLNDEKILRITRQNPAQEDIPAMHRHIRGLEDRADALTGKYNSLRHILQTMWAFEVVYRRVKHQESDDELNSLWPTLSKWVHFYNWFWLFEERVAETRNRWVPLIDRPRMWYWFGT